ncbi:MAG: DUF3048 domain-containing protein [Actinobacteria bacterium]|uniref:Unannotated protein n=1 Tax=freshwater metagenome TaxID=449393 RepID=A0A6J6S2Y6_9ZZZZ|nr:DUF3048 domain-containing protein [Actinomycetota bacterium]
MRRTTTSFGGRVAVVLAVASLALAGCGGGDDASSDEKDATKASAAAVEQATWPLTGLDVPGSQSAEQRHPVMVLKMDNTYASAPQLGLGSADLVVEELVEGGMTRLAAFFYSQIPGTVGPVRSMRASDIGIVSPVGADVVTSGAAPITISRIKEAGIAYFAEGAKGFFRDSSRSAPYNLFTDLKATTTLAQGPAERPSDYLPWGEAKDFPSGQPASTISASFSGAHTTDWVFRDGGYVNENTYAADGDEFPADTILVLRVQVGDAGYRDPAGNPVPETKFEGSGEAMIFHDGRLVRGTWTKDDLESPIELSTKAGPLTVPAGHTWVELVPSQGGDVTYAK